MMQAHVINLKRYSDDIHLPHFNDKLFSINDHALRIAVNDSNTFDWHYHQHSDELFVVLEGHLIIEFKDQQAISLMPNDSYCIPAGLIHRTIAKGRTVNLCIEADKDDTIFISN